MSSKVKDFCWHQYSPKERCPMNEKNCKSCNIRLQQIHEGEKFIYFGLPKCGSTSILRTLGTMDDVKFIPIKDLSEKVNDKFTFTFVRNPWSRILSCWNGWVNKKSNSRLFQINGIEKGMNFKDFVKAIAYIPDELADQHFVSLSYITEYKDQNLLDYYGKIENINDDWKYLVEKFNFSNIKHLAKTNIGDKLMKHYDDEMINIIIQRYKNDIVNFDYNLEKIIRK